MKVFTMGRLTISLDEDTEAIVEENIGDGSEYESKSEFVRECIRDHTRVQELEAEVERMENEKRLILEQREENAELVRYVEDERRVEQKWREAGLLTKTKWRLFGMSNDESTV